MFSGVFSLACPDLAVGRKISDFKGGERFGIVQQSELVFHADAETLDWNACALLRGQERTIVLLEIGSWRNRVAEVWPGPIHKPMDRNDGIHVAHSSGDEALSSRSRIRRDCAEVVRVKVGQHEDIDLLQTGAVETALNVAANPFAGPAQ